MKLLHIKKKVLLATSKAFFWFATGALLAFFLLISFTFIIFEKVNSDVVYPGIMVGNVDLSRYTQEEVSELFDMKNESIVNSKITFSDGINIATVSAKELELGYDSNLIAKLTITTVRSGRFLSNLNL